MPVISHIIALKYFKQNGVLSGSRNVNVNGFSPTVALKYKKINKVVFIHCLN